MGEYLAAATQRGWSLLDHLVQLCAELVVEILHFWSRFAVQYLTAEIGAGADAYANDLKLD